MTDDFLWGGINIRKFCRFFFKNFWVIIIVIIITYLGLGFVDKLTYTPSYTSTAVAAVYPKSSSYRYHTIENVSNLSEKTAETSSVFNSVMFQSGLHNQESYLQDCIIDSFQVANTDLLVIHATSGNPENAFKGIWAALEYYSQFSGSLTGAPEIRIILGPDPPSLIQGGSKIQNHRLLLCVLTGLMTSGLLLIMYAASKTYKTERCIKRRYKNIRFYSVPSIISESENIKRIFSKKNSKELIKKFSLEIKQVLHKHNKNTLFITSYADDEGAGVFLSELTRELAEQNEKVILIETKAWQRDSTSGLNESDDIGKHTLQDVLQQKCTIKDVMSYSEELKGYCIQCNFDSTDENDLYSSDDFRNLLCNCLKYADIVLIDGVTCYPSHYAQIWLNAADASLALLRQDDAGFFKVDKILSDLQKRDAYFAGCVLLGF